MPIKNKQIQVTSNFDINSNRLINVDNPVDNLDAINKQYLDDIKDLTAEFSINNKNMVASATNADGDLATIANVTDDVLSTINVKVNGNNIPTGSALSCYFQNPSSPFEIRSRGDEQKGDELRWNGSIALYQLEISDVIDYVYLTNAYTNDLATLTTGAAVSIFGDSATTGGDITDDGGATITQRGVVYSTSSNPTTGDNKIVSGNGVGTFVINLTGLSGGTTYYVRAYAINNVGTAYGNEETFVTAISSPSITTNAVTTITDTTATSGGNVTSDGGGTVTERGIVYATTSNPTTAGNKVTSGTGTGTYVSNMTGLTALTTYYVRAYAINSSGTAYGDETFFNTDSPVTVPTVTTNAAVSITDISAESGGNVTSNGGTAVTEKGIVYATTSNPTTADTKLTSGTGTGAYTSPMTGLTAETTYYIRAYAINTEGTAYGTQQSFATTAVVSTGLELGYIYNAYPVLQSEFAPDEWKVPSETELITLKSYMTNNGYNGNEAQGLKSTTEWASNTGDDAFGFNGRPAGYRSDSNGAFLNYTASVNYWTNTPDTATQTHFGLFQSSNQTFSIADFNNTRGYSVRLIYTGSGSPANVTDRDGNIYTVVQIGTQYWTVQNWKCTKLNNGISIPNVTDNTEWVNLGSGTGINYKYGYLYNWYTIDGNSTNLINGMHSPSDTEWSTLFTYVGGLAAAGGELKEVGTEHWTTPNTGALNNTYGFTALPSGLRQSGGPYTNLTEISEYWCSNEFNATFGNTRYTNYTSAAIGSEIIPKTVGLAIRCVRDLTAQEQIDYSDGDIVEAVTDFDGNSYGVIRVGTQGWTNMNLRTTHYTTSIAIPTGFDDTAWAGLTVAGYSIYDDSTLDNPNGLCAYDNDENNV